jgi:glycosyltransferase involved in cell wall biosynthesis
MNKPTLGGTLFIRNGNKYDYCYKEAIQCLQELCDQVIVLDAGSDDGTIEEIRKLANKKTTLVFLDNKEWEAQGKERTKLAYFTNKAASFLETDWHVNLQGDEIIHQDSFPYIREAISRNDSEGYWCSRINCWGSTRHALNVTNDRKPVGTEVLRLAKTGYPSVDDAQSLSCPASFELLDKIRIYHYGFVRNKYVHCEKIRYMITQIFNWEMDKKVEEMEGVFNPWKHFSKDDVIEIKESTPKFVRDWADRRDMINDFM